MEKIKVLVADDHSIVREGIRQLISHQPDMKLVGEAVDGREALSKIKTLKPDVVILDIAMPKLSGLNVIPLIKEAAPTVHILILSMFAKEAYVHQALSSGAVGYIIKTAASTEVVEAVRKTLRGEYFLSAELNAEVIKRYLSSENNKTASKFSKYDLLSDREQQVFRLVIEGNPTKDIAEMLCVSPKTIEKHRSNISKKLGISDPVAMVKYAVKIGVADPELWKD